MILTKLKSVNGGYNLKIKFAVLSIMIFLVLTTSVFALTNSTEISDDIKDLQEVMEQMDDEGFSIKRYNDTLLLTRQMYLAQENVEDADFSLVEDKIDELRYLRKIAYANLDELGALELALNSSTASDLTDAYALYDEAYQEFEDERYEQSLDLIDETYEKISELEAVETKIKAFYEATSRNIVDFLKSKWKEILAILVTLTLIILLTHNKVFIRLIERNILYLNKRRETIQSLIAKTQKDYFEKGKISESEYHTRINKYSELLRDINRQVPLLKEELAVRQKKNIFGMDSSSGKKQIRIKKDSNKVIKTKPAFSLGGKKPSADKSKKEKESIFKRFKLPDIKLSQTKKMNLKPIKISKPTLPKVKAPKVKSLKINKPTIPKLKMPKIKVPKFRAPKMPDLKLPKFKKPKLNLYSSFKIKSILNIKESNKKKKNKK